MEHLTASEIGAFAERKLAAVELLECGRHLMECEACRSAVEAHYMAEAGAERRAENLRKELMEPEEHLSYEVIRMLVDGEKVAKEAEEHLTSCGICKAEVAELRKFAGEIEGRPRAEIATGGARWIPWLHPAWGVAFASVLVIGSLGIFWWMMQVVQRQSEVVATIEDGGHKLELQSDGTMRGAEELPQPLQRLMQKAIAEGRIESASPFASDGRKAETILGASESGEGFHLLYPVGEASADERPNFRWEAMEGAEHYEVQIFGAGYKMVAESGELDATSWRSTVALPRDAVYTWTVTAKSKTKSVREPAPPEPEAAFKVVSAAEALKIAEARRDYPNDHLLMAIVDADAGAMTEARGEVEQLEAENPGSALVAKLKAGLNQRPPSPIKTNGAQ